MSFRKMRAKAGASFKSFKNAVPMVFHAPPPRPVQIKKKDTADTHLDQFSDLLDLEDSFSLTDDMFDGRPEERRDLFIRKLHACEAHLSHTVEEHAP
jgi:hypothetical protein